MFCSLNDKERYEMALFSGFKWLGPNGVLPRRVKVTGYLSWLDLLLQKYRQYVFPHGYLESA